MDAGDKQTAALRGIEKLVSRVFGAEPGEYAAALWSFTYFFCLLGAYYILRPVREAMGVASGPETIPYLFAGTFVTMLAITPVFGWIASRYPRKTFLPWIYTFFILNILVFWGLFSLHIGEGNEYVWLGRVFFVWISVFNLFVVAVFWSFMADLFTRRQARRLFGLIAAGGSIGALAGGLATRSLVVSIGFENLFPFSAALLAIAVFCIFRLRRWVEQSGAVASSVTGVKPLGGSPFAGITHVFRSPYFMGMVAKTIIASLLGTALYMFTAELAADAFTSDNERTRFFADVNNATNAIALALQLVVVKQSVARLGIGVTLSMMPIVSMAGFAILAVEPTLLFVAILTVVRRSLGFGFSKPTSDMLYSVVTAEEKYKVKNFIDTVVYRGGDVIGTWTIRAMMSALGMIGTSLAMIPFAAAWAGIAIWLGRDYRRRAGEGTAGA